VVSTQDDLEATLAAVNNLTGGPGPSTIQIITRPAYLVGVVPDKLGELTRSGFGYGATASSSGDHHSFGSNYGADSPGCLYHVRASSSSVKRHRCGGGPFFFRRLT